MPFVTLLQLPQHCFRNFEWEKLLNAWQKQSEQVWLITHDRYKSNYCTLVTSLFQIFLEMSIRIFKVSFCILSNILSGGFRIPLLQFSFHHFLDSFFINENLRFSLLRVYIITLINKKKNQRANLLQFGLACCTKCTKFSSSELKCFLLFV